VALTAKGPKVMQEKRGLQVLKENREKPVYPLQESLEQMRRI